MGTLSEILKEQWQWRKQILSLGLFDLKKTSAGAVLGPLWFFAKPAVYILVFWFALEVGLRSADQTGSDVPYILWLMVRPCSLVLHSGNSRHGNQCFQALLVFGHED